MFFKDFGEIRKLADGPGDLLEHQQKPRSLRKALKVVKKKTAKKAAPILSLERQLGVQLPSPPQPTTQSEPEGLGTSRSGRQRKTPARLQDFEFRLASKPRPAPTSLTTSTPTTQQTKKRKLEVRKTPSEAKTALEGTGKLQAPPNKVKQRQNKIIADIRQNSFVVTGHRGGVGSTSWRLNQRTPRAAGAPGSRTATGSKNQVAHDHRRD